jgi:hypothetical protein
VNLLFLDVNTFSLSCPVSVVKAGCNYKVTSATNPNCLRRRTSVNCRSTKRPCVEATRRSVRVRAERDVSTITTLRGASRAAPSTMTLPLINNPAPESASARLCYILGARIPYLPDVVRGWRDKHP